MSRPPGRTALHAQRAPLAAGLRCAMRLTFVQMNTAALAESVADKVLAGERITRDDALELYRLPLNELGELAHLRRNMIALKA